MTFMRSSRRGAAHEWLHLRGVDTAHDRHGHVHEHDVEGLAVLGPLLRQRDGLLPVAGHFADQPQVGQHLLRHPLVDQVVLCQQRPPPLHAAPSLALLTRRSVAPCRPLCPAGPGLVSMFCAILWILRLSVCSTFCRAQGTGHTLVPWQCQAGGWRLQKRHLEQGEVELAVAQLHAGPHRPLLARLAEVGQPVGPPTVLLPAHRECVAAQRVAVVHHGLQAIG